MIEIFLLWSSPLTFVRSVVCQEPEKLLETRPGLSRSDAARPLQAGRPQEASLSRPGPEVPVAGRDGGEIPLRHPGQVPLQAEAAAKVGVTREGAESDDTSDPPADDPRQEPAPGGQSAGAGGAGAGQDQSQEVQCSPSPQCCHRSEGTPREDAATRGGASLPGLRSPLQNGKFCFSIYETRGRGGIF